MVDIHYILWYYHPAMIHVRFLFQREGGLLRRPGSDRVRIAHVYARRCPVLRGRFWGLYAPSAGSLCLFEAYLLAVLIL